METTNLEVQFRGIANLVSAAANQQRFSKNGGNVGAAPKGQTLWTDFALAKGIEGLKKKG